MGSKEEQQKQMDSFLIEIQANINYYIDYFNSRHKHPVWSSKEQEQSYAIYMINNQLDYIKKACGEDEVFKQIEKLKINYRLKP